MEAKTKNDLTLIDAEPVETRLEGASLDVVAEKRRELLELFPEVRTEDDKIDFERLQLVLGESVDIGRERYGLTWPGKAECFRTIQAPSMATLLPDLEKSVNFDTTENLIIEGDNLEVLKLLQKSYLGKVKMIYIDPPYNTGSDFIYPDDYSESLKTYLQYTGQVDPEGKRFGTNTDAEGRFHSKWLNMMYPRLYLARNLLREDGIIVVSIDDTESQALRSIMNEVFGEQNFIGCVVWNSTKSVTNTALISVSHTYNFIYASEIAYYTENRSRFRLPEPGDGFANPDNDPRGPWKADPFQVGGVRPNQQYVIVNPKTGKEYRPNPGCSWKNEEKVFKLLSADNRIVFGATGGAGPQRKRFQSEAEERGRVAKTLWDDLPTTSNATRTLDDLFGEHVFDNPKPVDLVERFVQLGVYNPNDGVILDFFAGSGTTAEAALDLNAQDGGNRKFILVQLPEPAGRANYSTIAEICEERVRRVIKKLNDADGGKLKLDEAPARDRGFKVFKLAQSNVKEWDSTVPRDVEALKTQLELSVDHLRDDRSDLDVVYEVLLKEGYSLSIRVSTEEVGGKRVYSVAEGIFIICLERNLSLDSIRAIAARKPQPERVLFLDEGFAGNDQLKTNAKQTFTTKGITFRTL